MRFEHITYEEKTGKNSKQIETYNFHKAASVLTEYGFDCVRITNDWRGADFLAYHPETSQTLEVQLKTCLVIDEKYRDYEDLYMCFPLDETGNWYLIKHSRLMEIMKEKAPKRFRTKTWKKKQSLFTYKANEDIKEALEEFVYKPTQDHLGFREAAERVKTAHASQT